MKPRAVITGGTGYIGSHLSKLLIKEGWDVYIIAEPHYSVDYLGSEIQLVNVFEYDGEINSLIAFFQETKPQVVFHLAAAVITNYKSSDIKRMITSNVLFGTEVLEAAKLSDCSYFISTGTIWQSYNQELYNPVDLYAASKEAFEKILRVYTETTAIRAITLRLFDIYGEDDKRPKLLNLIRDVVGTDTYIDISPSEQYLDMVHISDVVQAYLAAYKLLSQNQDIKNRVYGVFTGDQRTLKEILTLYAKVLDIPLQVNFGGKSYKEREVMLPYNGLDSLPNWQPLLDLESGFELFRNE